MAKAASTPTHRRLEGQDSRQLILAVALELFTKRGYDGTSIDDIRQAAGFRSKASLYTHFKSKEDVSEALTTHILGQMEEAILAAHRAAADEPMAQFVAGVNHLHSLEPVASARICLSLHSSTARTDADRTV